MRRLGYCCINLSLKHENVTTNRGMTKKTFLEKGMDYVSELSLKNTIDLKKVLEWNGNNGIRMYRMSSDIFPWCSEYELKDLRDFEEIAWNLKQAGDISKTTDQRITFHPSPYGVLASENQSVVTKAIKEISQHSEIMDLMNLDRNRFYPINIHVNTTKPSKEEALQRFCENYELLPESAKKRLVVEIDDKKSQYNCLDLFNGVYQKINVPITFDFLHNKCNPHPDYDEKRSLELCLSTWQNEGFAPITHFSDSRKIFEDNSAKDLAHSDWVWSSIETYDLDFDIEFEVKMKDLALLKYIEREKILNYGEQTRP
jgi:UV DNA damage endonuclease